MGYCTHILFYGWHIYDKLKQFGIGISANIDEFSCKNDVFPLLDRQPTRPEVTEKQLLSCPRIPSSKKLNTFPRDLQKFGSDSNFFPQQYTDGTSFAHARSSQTTISTPTQKSPLPIKTTYSTEETASECRHFHTDDRSRSADQSQQLMLERFSGCICPIRNEKCCPDRRHMMHFCIMSLFRDMLCFFSSVVCVFEKCC